MASNVVTVSLIGDASKLNKAFSDSERSAKSWGDKMGSAGKSLTVGLTLPIVAGAGLAVKAAAEEEQQMSVLANAIKNNIPDATDEAIAANEDWITSMQNATGVADSDLRNAIQQLVQAGVPLEEAQRQTATAMDIAASKGKDLGTVTEALVKANNGQTGALRKMGLATEDAGGQALTLDQILQGAAETMGGAAATAADTAAGKTAIMQARLADATETIGTMLIPILEKLVGMLSSVVEWFQNLSPGAQKAIVALAGVAAAVGPVLIIGAKAITMFGNIGKAFKVLSGILAANPWVLLIMATVALVVLIIKNWDKISAFLKKTWETIKSGVAAVGKFITDTWNNVIGFLSGLPSRIARAVSGMWDGVKNAFRSAVNWIIDKWNGLRISIGGGKILGVSIPKIVIDTPNIPRFHSGGVFRSPGGGEGLAMLRDGERVIPPGRRTAASAVNIEINAGFGSDPNAIAKAVLEALQRYQRTNGPLPLDVRIA